MAISSKDFYSFNLVSLASRQSIVAVIGFVLAMPAAVNGAQGGRLLEEIVVTAQRIEESIQDVPIAITALTGEMLEDKGVISVSDLQMAMPNVSFTRTNFGGSSFRIRGIGSIISGESGVSSHINEIPLGSAINGIEFLDVKRVEVLRGPQGTLYGRNATGGSVNIITNMPEYDAVKGYIDIEAGDYDHLRIKGAINVPLGRSAGLRLAGLKLDRDGYIENTASGMVGSDGSLIPYIDDDIDGRDLYAWRATLSWDFSDNGNVWVQYSDFDEDDDRARITNQVCQRTALPALGCEPDGFGFDTPHYGSVTGVIFFGLNGILPLGASGENGVNGINITHPAPANNGFREMHTDFEPVYQLEEEIWQAGIEYQIADYTVSMLAAYRELEYVAQMDFNMFVGATLAASPEFLGLDGRWPTSAPAGGPGGDVKSGPCNYFDGTSGIFGGCTVPNDGTRAFAMDQSSSYSEYWTVEFRARSHLDGFFNFQVGISAYESEGYGDYYVAGNSLDMLGLLGAPALGFPPAYPSMFNTPGNALDPAKSDGEAVFAEAYFDINDRMKLTVGLRRNRDTKRTNSTSAFLSSFDQSVILDAFIAPVFSTFVDAALGLSPGTLGLDAAGLAGFGVIDPNYEANLAMLPGNSWGRNAGVLFGNPSDQEAAVLAFHDVPQSQIDQAMTTLPYSAERVALVSAVGTIIGWNETRALTGSPTKEEFTATTGRIGIDYQLSNDIMVYGFFSRGNKPGGFNPPIAPEFQDDSTFTFDNEEVDAIEIGFRSTLANGSVILNGTAFVYDYKGLQVQRTKNNSLINENIDADIMGIELEWFWNPASADRLVLDGSLSWLDTELDDFQTIDVTNRSGGDPDWINLKNIDPGAQTGTNYVAYAPGITPAVVTAALSAPVPGALSERNGATVPGTTYANGIPAYFSRNWLEANSIPTSSGLPVNVGGNELPNSPEFSFRLGMQYTWPIAAIAGDLTLRWDYYWQEDSYAREFNTVGDQIDSWDQHNMSLIYESNDGNWQARAFVRNLEDEDNVTGHFLSSDTAGYFRNYFLTEPRIYGFSVRYSFDGS